MSGTCRDTADIFEQLLWYRKQVKPGKGARFGIRETKKAAIEPDHSCEGKIMDLTTPSANVREIYGERQSLFGETKKNKSTNSQKNLSE